MEASNFGKSGHPFDAQGSTLQGSTLTVNPLPCMLTCVPPAVLPIAGSQRTICGCDLGGSRAGTAAACARCTSNVGTVTLALASPGFHFGTSLR